MQGLCWSLLLFLSDFRGCRAPWAAVLSSSTAGRTGESPAPVHSLLLSGNCQVRLEMTGGLFSCSFLWQWYPFHEVEQQNPKREQAAGGDSPEEGRKPLCKYLRQYRTTAWSFNTQTVFRRGSLYYFMHPSPRGVFCLVFKHSWFMQI